MKYSQISSYNYSLPEGLIAQKPTSKRDNSRLLVLDKITGEYEDKHFFDIIDYLNENDVLVLNNTKVLPARIIGQKSETLANIELLLIKETKKDTWECLTKPQKRVKKGTIITFSNNLKCNVLELLEDGLTIVKFEYVGIFLERLEEVGMMPLPPYIHEDLKDKKRYQTIYAKHLGSSAAPTAGLHFTDELLKKIRAKGIEIIEITLHVGLGTFRPVNEEDITKHKMHSELYEISKNAAERLNLALKNKKRIVCVGTTSVRTLESNYNKYGEFVSTMEETDIFIYPPYKFKVVSSLITNFHLPKSTLLMLVSSLAGRNNIINAYNHAVCDNYKFFSFGDAMLITDLEINSKKVVKDFLKKNECFIKKDGFKIYKGKNNVIVSVPHAYKHIRNNTSKANEYNTVNLAKILYNYTNCHIIYQYKNNSTDANYNISGSYKETLESYIKENNIKYLVDLHGCENDSNSNIEIGTNYLKNINNDSSLLEEISEIIKNTMTKNIAIDERFKASSEFTISNYMNSKTGIFAFQFEIRKNYRKLKRKPKTFNRTTKCFISIIKHLEEREG